MIYLIKSGQLRGGVMNITIFLKDNNSGVKSKEVLDNALLNSFKKYHTSGFRIDNPEWKDEEHKIIKVPVRLDEISELDNYLDKDRYDHKRMSALNHVLKVLSDYLRSKEAFDIYSVGYYSDAVGELFPGTYDLKMIELFSCGSDKLTHIARVVVNSKGEYWTRKPDVIM